MTTDAAARHRELRRQYVAQQRAAGDGHSRRPGGQVSKAELRRRRARRRAKQQAQQRLRTAAVPTAKD